MRHFRIITPSGSRGVCRSDAVLREVRALRDSKQRGAVVMKVRADSNSRPLFFSQKFSTFRTSPSSPLTWFPHLPGFTVFLFFFVSARPPPPDCPSLSLSLSPPHLSSLLVLGGGYPTPTQFPAQCPYVTAQHPSSIFFGGCG